MLKQRTPPPDNYDPEKQKGISKRNPPDVGASDGLRRKFIIYCYFYYNILSPKLQEVKEEIFYMTTFETYDLPELYRHLPEYVNSITEKRKSKKYNCPLCNSGKRENGTPAFNLYDDGIKCHCHSCGFDGNIIGLYLAVNDMSDTKANVNVAIRSLAGMYGMIPTSSTAHTATPKQPKAKKTRIGSRIHLYTDKTGVILARKTITKYSDGSKSPFWSLYHPDTHTFSNGLKGLQMPLYHADRIHNSQGTVYFVEGEKDVETMENCYGVTATSTPNGGGQTSWNTLYNEDLSGRDIIILTDNDPSGENYGRTVAKNVSKIAKSVKIIPTKSFWDDCPEKGDISDAIEALGQDRIKQALSDAVQNAEFYQPESELSNPNVINPLNEENLPRWILTIPKTVKSDAGETVTVYSYKVHTARLSQHIRSISKYFFVRDGHMEFVRRFWYDETKGVYSFTTTSDIENMVVNCIEGFNADLLRMRDVHEVAEIITTAGNYISESEVNSDEALINFRNGLFNWKTEKFLQHTSEIRTTVQINAEYIPGKTYTLADDAPVFEKYLNDLTEGNEEKKQLLLEYIGACISNVRGYKYKKVLFLIGASDSGKSQFLRLICELLGNENFAAVNFKNLDDRFQTSNIYGKRLVCAADTLFDKNRTNGYFMNMSGGDALPIEYKGHQPFNAVFNGFMLFSSNIMPTWSGNETQAAYNRMLCVKCDNSIPKEQQDSELLDKMMKERNAIVYLALEKFKKTVANGYRFTIPAESAAVVAEIRRYNNPVIDFFESCCTRYEDADTNIEHCCKRSVVHDIFRDWCKQNASDTVLSSQEFKSRLMEYLHLREEKQIIRIYKGARYYKFSINQETLSEFRPGSVPVS